MKAFDRTFAGMLAGIAAVLIVCNLFLYQNKDKKESHAYVIEVNRLMNYYKEHLDRYQKMDEIQNLDISTGGYPENKFLKKAEFLSSKADAKNQWYRSMVWIVNLCIIISGIGLTVTCLYIRNVILKPFLMMRDLPYELSKGHISNQLKETKNKYFGRFIWGLNLLKISIDERKKREMQLEREKKLMILIISHDIKTPLSSIRLYARAFKEGIYCDSNKMQEAAVQIEDKVSQIEGFIKEIVNMSTTELLDLPVLIEEFYLKDFVLALNGYYKEKLSLLKTEFVIREYSDKLLLGDQERLMEVMENLLENAIKYGDGRLIEITFEEEEYCQLITVYNTGCTLKKEELVHVFDSFWRGENVYGKEGNGLGLYICKEIMHRMDGEVFVQLHEEGIAFTIVVPEV